MYIVCTKCVGGVYLRCTKCVCGVYLVCIHCPPVYTLTTHVAHDDKFVKLLAKYGLGGPTNFNQQRQIVRIILGRAVDAAGVKAEDDVDEDAAGVKAEEGATAKAEEGAARATAKPEEGAARATAPAKPEEGGPQPEDVSDEDEVKLVPQLILLKDVITSIWKAGGEKFPYDNYTSRYTPYEYPAYTLPTPSIYPLYALTSPRVHPP